jgi:hypothetical protein
MMSHNNQQKQTRFHHFALMARKRFGIENDDVLRLIHEYTHTLRIVPHHLHALYAPIAMPYALLQSSSLSSSGVRFIMRVGCETVLEESTLPAEYHHSENESVAVRMCIDPTLVPTEAVEVLFHGEVQYHYHHHCVEERVVLCLDPWLATRLSVELFFDA